MKKIVFRNLLFIPIILLSNVVVSAQSAQSVIYVAKPTKWTGSSGRQLHGNLNGNIYDLGFNNKVDGVDPRDQQFYYTVYSVTAMDSKFKALNTKIEAAEKAHKKELEIYRKEIEELKSQIISLKKQASTTKSK